MKNEVKLMIKINKLGHRNDEGALKYLSWWKNLHFKKKVLIKGGYIL